MSARGVRRGGMVDPAPCCQFEREFKILKPWRSKSPWKRRILREHGVFDKNTMFCSSINCRRFSTGFPGFYTGFHGFSTGFLRVRFDFSNYGVFLKNTCSRSSGAKTRCCPAGTTNSQALGSSGLHVFSKMVCILLFMSDNLLKHPGLTPQACSNPEHCL